MKTTTTTTWCWRSLLGYSVILIIAGFAISLVLIKSVVLPRDFGLPGKSPYDPYFFLGCALLMIVAAIASVILNWRLKEFLLAFAIASGLLMGNPGYGLGFTLVCAVIYLGVSKIVQVIRFYFPRNIDQNGSSDGDLPPN